MNKKILNRENYLLFLSILILASLRIINLGYSHYLDDETTVLQPIKNKENIMSVSFMLNQTKGPLQWFVAYFSTAITKDIFNQFLTRLPFALINITSFIMLYFYVKNISKSKLAGIITIMVVGLNGLLVAFGRIIQYQSLNLLFSISSIYFFQKYKNVNNRKYFHLGMILFTLSALSHWDAILFLPIIFYHLIASKNYKEVIKLTIPYFLIYTALLYVYISFNLKNTNNLTYIGSRSGFHEIFLTEKLEYYKFVFDLYNPFVFSYFLIIVSFIYLLFYKKILPYLIWYLCTLLFYIIFVKHSGTHIYNILIPFSICYGLTVSAIYKSINFKVIKFMIVGFNIALFTFFYYQNYMIFLKNDKEYPFERVVFFNKYTTKKYDHTNLTNNIVGFPINREWNKIRIYVDEYTKANPNVTYITNDSTSTANLYLNIEPKLSKHTLIIGVKRPITFVNDYKHSRIKNKRTIHKIRNNNGETVANIYLYKK